MLNIKKILSLILIMLSLFIFSSCDDEGKIDDFEYTISKVVTSDKDMDLQNYTASYYDDDYETNYKYAGNIKNNNALADDSIIEFITREYFTNEGVYSYMDQDYGYYIVTKELNDNSYASNVFLFDLMYYMANTHLDLAFRPLFSTEYRTIPLNERYNNIKAIGDGTYNNVIIPTFNELDYNISNLEITTQISNSYFLNSLDEKYDVNLDKGSFISIIESGILKNQDYFLHTITNDKLIDENITPSFYMRNNDDEYKIVENTHKLKDDFCYAFYLVSEHQINEFNHLIKDIKTKFKNDKGNEVLLKTNKCEVLPTIKILLSSSILNIIPGTNIDIDISFDILDKNNNFIDNVNTSITCNEYYNGKLSIDEKYKVSSYFYPYAFMVEVEESGEYELNIIKNSSLYSNVKSSVYELIDNLYLEPVYSYANSFTLEAGKTYIFNVKYNITDIEQNDVYLALNKIN